MASASGYSGTRSAGVPARYRPSHGRSSYTLIGDRLLDGDRIHRSARRVHDFEGRRDVEEGVLAVGGAVLRERLEIADLGEQHAEVPHQGAVQREGHARLRIDG